MKLTPKNEIERRALEELAKLQAEGKNPHGRLRDLLDEMAMREG